MNLIKQPNKILSIILMLSLLLIPLLNFPSHYLNLPRLFVLYGSALILITVLIFNYKNLRLDGTDRILIVFLLLIVISTILSIDIKKSILGRTGFYEGALAIFVYALYYYVAKHYMVGNKKIIHLLMIQSVIISLIGILQLYGIGATFDISYTGGPSGFAFGTFGYHNYFGSYITLFLTLSAYLFMLSKKKIYLITSLILFSAMLASLTRSAWLACAICMLIILILFQDFKQLKRFVILLILFTIPFIVIFKTNMGIAWKFSFFKSDVETILNEGISDKLGSERIWIWRNSLEILNENKLTGVGLENFSEAVLANCSKPNRICPEGVNIGTAHNEYLQIAVTTGIPATIIYIIFLFSNLKMAIKNNKSVNLLLISVIGYMIQAFFNISIIAIAPIFWVFLGLIVNKEFNKRIIKDLEIG